MRMTPEQHETVPAWERPIRIPERTDLCHAEPETALAGQKGTWRLHFRLSETVPPGAALKLQLFGGRNNRPAFEKVQVERPADEGHLTVSTEGGEPLNVRADKQPGTFVIVAPQQGLPCGSRLLVTLGDTSGGSAGVEVPRIRTPNKFFVLYRADADEDPPLVWTEEDQHKIVGACLMHILGGDIHHLRAYAPSQVGPGQRLWLTVRPEDEFSNLSHQTLDDVAVSLDGEPLEAAVEPAPESTAVRVRVQAPREGILRFTVHDRRSGKETVTNPTICSSSRRPHEVHWGMIHGHTEMSDGTGSLEYYFRQMRDEAGLDFAAPGDHDHTWETSDAMWRFTCDTVARWNEPERFVVFLGYEWAKWRRNGDGDRNVYYLDDRRPMYRSDEDNFPRPPDLFRALRGEKAIVIPHHPAHSGNFCDWKDHEPTCERLVEIFQCRGSYECRAEDGNPVPERTASPPVPAGYVRRALGMGWRVGFTAGGDDHIGHSGTDYPRPDGKPPYMAGLTAVLAAERTRQSIWDGLWHRRTVATTGPRILLNCELDGHPIGAELNAEEAVGLQSQRRLRIEFHGTAPADRIEIIRNNEVVHAQKGGGLDVELDWMDDAPLQDALLPPARFSPQPFCFYYVRAVQTDGHVAWTSPIWIVAE